MTVRDELVRAAVYAGDAEAVVRVHRLAPLVEYAVLIQQAVDAEPVIEAAVAERTADLERELVAVRRDAALAWGRVAALEVAV